MKRTAQIIFGLLLIALSPGSMAQSTPELLPKPANGIRVYPDSVRIEFPEQNAILVFQFKEIKVDLAQIEMFPAQLQLIDQLVRKSVPDMTIPQKVVVRELEGGDMEVRVSENDKLTLLRASKDSLKERLTPGWELYFSTQRTNIFLYIADWAKCEEIPHQNFDLIRSSIQAKMDQEYIGRKRTISRVIYKNKGPMYNDTKFQMPLDMIAFNAHVAFGFFRNSYYPELTLSALVHRHDHFNRPYSKMGLVWENKFFTTSTETGLKGQTNSFLSAAFSFNFYRLDEPFWIGFGGGLLIRNSGDYFQGKTAKFFIETGAKKFTLVPEMYLTNDFKTFSLGAKLSYTF